MNYLQVALDMASQAHVNQSDKGGEPYIFHPIRVERRVAANPILGDTGRFVARMVALLHDVMEDSEMFTWQQVREAFGSWGNEVELSLIALTHKRGEPYDAYIDRIINWGSHVVLAVKLADLEDNLDVSRLPLPLTERDMLRLEKYRAAKARIEAELRGSNP